LAVAGAFHTPVMQPAVEKLSAALAGVTLAPLSVPVWANVNARAYADADEVRATLARQVVQPGRRVGTLLRLRYSRATRLPEDGVGAVVAGLFKRVSRKTECRNVMA